MKYEIPTFTAVQITHPSHSLLKRLSMSHAYTHVFSIQIHENNPLNNMSSSQSQEDLKAEDLIYVFLHAQLHLFSSLGVWLYIFKHVFHLFV